MSIMDTDLNQLARDTLCDEIKTNYVDIDGVVLPEEYKNFAEEVDNFEVFDDDVYVCSFQKSGTTWAQEMVWCIANDLDFDKASAPINARFPYLEFDQWYTDEKIDEDALLYYKSVYENLKLG